MRLTGRIVKARDDEHAETAVTEAEGISLDGVIDIDVPINLVADWIRVIAKGYDGAIEEHTRGHRIKHVLYGGEDHVHYPVVKVEYPKLGIDCVELLEGLASKELADAIHADEADGPGEELLRLSPAGGLQVMMLDNPQEITHWVCWPGCEEDEEGREFDDPSAVAARLDLFKHLMQSFHDITDDDWFLKQGEQVRPDQTLNNVVWAGIVKRLIQDGEVVYDGDHGVEVYAFEQSIHDELKRLGAILSHLTPN